MVNAGDWNGDGYQDVIVRRTKKVYLLRGTKTGQLASRVSMGFGGGIRTMTGIGDANGDGRPDLAVITETGNLWLYYGDGKTGRKSKTKISSGWADHDWLRAPGDFDRDGRVDLITELGDRVLLHRGTKSGFAAPVTLASRWSGVSTIASVGDVTGDEQSRRARPDHRRQARRLRRRRQGLADPRRHSARLVLRYSIHLCPGTVASCSALQLAELRAGL